MKKRIMLIVAFGVSFTPAIFAGTDSGLGRPVILNHTGEQKIAEMEPGSTQCSERTKNLAGPSFSSSSKESKSFSAGGR